MTLTSSDDSRVRAGVTRPRAHSGAGRQIRRPDPLALEYAADVAARVSARPAPVRNGFIETLRPETKMPPLATMLRGGQGGSVRLKLLLSLLWFSVRPPHETIYPARGWAAMLGLPQPNTNGARRVSAALDWLAQHHLVRIEQQRGQPSIVYVLDERGTNEPYRLPYEAMVEKQAAGTELTRDDYWVNLPATFWTKGWITVLSASAIAMLLVLLDESRYARRTERLWHSPAQARDRFGLSQDIRSAGLRELELYNVVVKRRTSISPGVFDFKRLRNVYDLHVEQLTVLPGEHAPREVTVTPETLAAESEEIDKLLAVETRNS